LALQRTRRPPLLKQNQNPQANSLKHKSPLKPKSGLNGAPIGAVEASGDLEVTKMPKAIIWLGPMVLLAGFVWTQELAPTEIQDYKEPEAYKIYSMLLSPDTAEENSGANTIVINMETQPTENCVTPDKESEKILSSAVADYKKQNAKKWHLQRQFDLSRPYELISNDELHTLFSVPGGGGWEKFYERHPGSGGVNEFSAVGFNAEKTVAILSSGHACGSLCGGGTFEILQKSKGKWVPLKTKASTCSWAS
jgi:hypothetical protein